MDAWDGYIPDVIKSSHFMPSFHIKQDSRLPRHQKQKNQFKKTLFCNLGQKNGGVLLIAHFFASHIVKANLVVQNSTCVVDPLQYTG